MKNVVTLKLSKPASHKRKLKQLCAWIDAHLDQPIGWAELVTHSGMDHVELQRQFSTYLKTSPMQWIRSRRMQNKALSSIHPAQASSTRLTHQFVHQFPTQLLAQPLS
jgi:AraC-like DNA-binding protein